MTDSPSSRRPPPHQDPNLPPANAIINHLSGQHKQPKTSLTFLSTLELLTLHTEDHARSSANHTHAPNSPMILPPSSSTPPAL